MQCCCKYGKELILKANHNYTHAVCRFASLLQIWERTDFESKSQPNVVQIIYVVVVANMGKNWFWKQITTVCFMLSPPSKLLQIWERTDFESKSQLQREAQKRIISCCKYGKELILKANHNIWILNYITKLVVANMGKNWFWKQITTNSRF